MIRLAYAVPPSVRLATSPAWELVGYGRAIAQSAHPVVPGEMLQRWRRETGGLGLDALWSALAHPQFVPGFLVPAPEEPFGSIARDLRRVGEAPPEEVASGLRTVQAHATANGGPYPVLARGIERPEDFRETLIEQMRTFWEAVVAPHWAAHLAMLESEVLTRSRQLALHGARSLLDNLHDDAGWDGEDLVVDCGAIDLAVGGTPDLLLVPSIFVWPKIFVSPPGERGCSVLYYPARGAATLFLESGRSEAAGAPAALERLLGRSRARILRALDEAATTTELASRFELSPGAVSQHLRRLDALGLVRRTRVGRRVYYERVARGDDLIRLFGGGAS
jgi:DNA-binding transcriptional ArsR family regulator